MAEPLDHPGFIRKCLEEGRDPHTAWAAHSLGKRAEDVTREERTQAKSENYCLLYSGDFLATVKWPQHLTQHL